MNSITIASTEETTHKKIDPASTQSLQTLLKEEWSTDKLRDLLSGKAEPPEGWPKRPINTTTDHRVGSFVLSNGLTPAQRHAICSKQFDAEIRTLRSQLTQSTEQGGEEELLSQLKDIYSARFRIDTVYQDLKVSEIERRAKKLRNELDARSEAEESWVKAMLTLAEMKADGIDTMPGEYPQSSPPISGFSQGVARTSSALRPRSSFATPTREIHPQMDQRRSNPTVYPGAEISESNRGEARDAQTSQRDFRVPMHNQRLSDPANTQQNDRWGNRN